MELFFMMTAMLALLGPIALGRVRCIRFAPRLFDLVDRNLSAASHPVIGAWLPRGRAHVVISGSTPRTNREPANQRQRPRYLADLLRINLFYSHSTP